MILLDTHAAIWFGDDNPNLGPRSKAAASAALADGELTISAVSFWEIALLISKNKIGIRIPVHGLRKRFLEAGVREIPLSGDIALLSVDLAGLPGDPADRFIVASAIASDAALMTADRKLLQWRNKLVRHDAGR